MQLQKLTTREPDLEQLAVAIAAMDSVLENEDPRNASDEDKVGMESWPRLDLVIESLVDQIEARYREVQEEMADPAVIADRQRYAEAGRQFNRLSPAAKLAEEWRRAVSDAEGRAGADRRGRRRSRAARGAPRCPRAHRGARGGDPPGDGRGGPQRRQERHRGDPRRRRRR
jgi:hypothetical protein